MFFTKVVFEHAKHISNLQNGGGGVITLFLRYRHLKLKLRFFLTGYTMAMVTYYELIKCGHVDQSFEAFISKITETVVIVISTWIMQCIS